MTHMRAISHNALHWSNSFSASLPCFTPYLSSLFFSLPTFLHSFLPSMLFFSVAHSVCTIFQLPPLFLPRRSINRPYTCSDCSYRRLLACLLDHVNNCLSMPQMLFKYCSSFKIRLLSHLHYVPLMSLPNTQLILPLNFFCTHCASL